MKGLKKTVAVIGHFAFGEECADGQTVKTKIVTEALSSHLGAKEILKIDTAGGKITLFKSPFQVIKAMRSAKNVLIFPAHNGLRIYVPLLSFFSKIFRKRHLHYAFHSRNKFNNIIGGNIAFDCQRFYILVVHG